MVLEWLQQEIDGIITLYTYNDNDHLLTETKNSIVTRYDYDDNGNTLTKTIDTVIDTTYSYSKDNRMLTADTSTSSISYSYDAGGIRQSQTVNGQTINYLVDPNRSYHQVLEEQDDLFMPQVVYTYGDDLISQTNAQGVYTFGYDGLGSTRILTDASGVVQNSYGYQAFGELDYQYGAIENNYLFTGEQYDNNVGFYYLRARYYNPGIGRFHNMDVFPGMQFEPKSLHKYLYTHADPINNIDPSGYITLGQVMSALRVAAIIATFATTDFQSLADIAARDGLAAAGGAFLLNALGGKFLKPLARICKNKGKKDNKCRYAIGWVKARLKMKQLLAKTPNSVRNRKNNRVYVVAAAWDMRSLAAVSKFNGPAPTTSISNKMKAHLRKFGACVGQENAFGSGNTLGRCAEFRSANTLARFGAKVKDIRFTFAYFVNKGSNGFTERGNIAPYCDACTTVHDVEN